MMSVDAGEMFVAGRYHSLIPIMQVMLIFAYLYEINALIVFL